MSNKAQEVLLQAANDIAIIVTDCDGHVTVFNPGAEQLLGFHADDIIGKKSPINDFDTLKDTFINNSKKSCHALCQHNNGDDISVHLTTSAIKDQNNKISGYLFMATPEPEFIHNLAELPDRRVFDIVLDRELRRMERDKQPLTLIRVDMDFHKAYLEKYGKDASEQVLKNIAHTINDRIQRAGDLLAYHGHDEFMIVLPRTDRAGAVKVAEYVRLMVAGLELENKASETTDIVTISCGIAIVVPGRETNIADMMLLAENGLQKAKADGRNCSRIGE